METGKTVLICEDDPVQLRILTTAFLQAGYRTVIARTPADASRKAGVERVDAILADVQLEGGSAFDILGDLHRTGLGVPVILASAYVTPKLRERAAAAGAARLHEKPCPIAEIVESINLARHEWITGRKAGRILVVEDHEPSRRVAAELLQEAGYDALLAENGEQALKLLTDSKAPVDTVLMDLTVPDPTGAELVRRIRAHDPAVEIVMLAGDASQEEIVAAYAEGASSLLRKPYTEDQFLQATRTHVTFTRRRRAAAASEAKERAARPAASWAHRMARRIQVLSKNRWANTAGLGALMLLLAFGMMEVIKSTSPDPAMEGPPSVEQQMLKEMRRFSDGYQKELKWYGITK